MLQEAELDKFEVFLDNTSLPISGWSKLPMDEFASRVYRIVDMVDAHGGNPEKVVKLYNQVHEKAWRASQVIFKEKGLDYRYDTIPKAVEREAHEVFATILKSEFYDTYLQYKWKQVQEVRAQTGVIDRGLYRDYESACDLTAFVSFVHPFYPVDHLSDPVE